MRNSNNNNNNNKKKHTDPLFALQYSQEEGLILIHNEFEKKANNCFSLNYKICFDSKIGHVFALNK